MRPAEGEANFISAIRLILAGTDMAAYCLKMGFRLNSSCRGDTNSGIPGITFPPETTLRIRNICKLATLFVKYNISEKWMRALIDIDFDDETSKQLSTVRYYECITDRLKEKGEEIFQEIMQTTRLRY